MRKTMNLCLFYEGGVKIDREIAYTGEDLEEIARKIDKDENDLLYYMRTGEEGFEKCFCFSGFMFRKEGILTAQFSEGVM